MTVSTFDCFLLAATFLVTTVFGEMLVFATVIMPGIAKLPDGDYLRAFQVIDGVIQANQPIFVAVWIGSVISLVVATGLGWSELSQNEGHRAGLLLAMIAYLVTQVTTFGINVPLNNRVKELQVANLDTKSKQEERARFEASWTFWNWFRVIPMGMVSLYLTYLLLIVE